MIRFYQIRTLIEVTGDVLVLRFNTASRSEYGRNMSTQNERFNNAARAAKSLPGQPDNNALLEIYALFKQATCGDVSGEKPGLFDFVATAKYEAWEQLRGIGEEDAQSRYIELIRSLGGEF